MFKHIKYVIISLCKNLDSGRKSGHIPALFYLPKKEACMSKITEEVETIITPILDDLNFELVDVEYAKEGKDRF